MNQKLKLIAIVGMTGSGKSVAAQFFRRQEIPVLRFGDITDTEVKRRGLELTPANERLVREDIRAKLGMAAYAIKIEPRIREVAQKYTLIVLDGLYSWEEYLYLNQRFPQLKILCIYASPAIRHKRLTTRKIRPLTETEAHARDVAEIENINKGGPIAIADYLIRNEGTPDEFTEKLEQFYKSI